MEKSWHSYFEKFSFNLENLQAAITSLKSGNLNPLEKRGVLHIYENTFTYSLETLKAFIQNESNVKLFGPKDFIEHGKSFNLIQNQDVWLEMISINSQTGYFLDEENITTILNSIQSSFYDEILFLYTRLSNFELDQISCGIKPH